MWPKNKVVKLKVTQPSCGYGLVAKSRPTFATPWTVARQASLSMGLSSKNTGVGTHALLQGIFPSLGSKPGLPNCRQILSHLSHQGSPEFGQIHVH